MEDQDVLLIVVIVFPACSCCPSGKTVIARACKHSNEVINVRAQLTLYFWGDPSHLGTFFELNLEIKIYFPKVLELSTCDI